MLDLAAQIAAVRQEIKDWEKAERAGNGRLRPENARQLLALRAALATLRQVAGWAPCLAAGSEMAQRSVYRAANGDAEHPNGPDDAA